MPPKLREQLAASVIVALGAVYGAYASGRKARPHDPHGARDAQSRCESGVRDRFASPSSVGFNGYGEPQWRGMDTVDITGTGQVVNPAGERRPFVYGCELVRDAGAILGWRVVKSTVHTPFGQ
jgi:hypothetical protein